MFDRNLVLFYVWTINMKIGIVTEYFFPLLGGITENVYNSSEWMKKSGRTVKIITSHVNSNPSDCILPHVSSEVIRIGQSVPVFSNGSIAHITVGKNLKTRIRSILEEEKFDILHIHSPLVITLPLITLLEARCLCVGTFHTYFERSLTYSLLKDYLQKKAVNKLDGLIAVSKSCIESLNRYFTVEPRIIPNGIDIDLFNPRVPAFEQFGKDKKNLLFLGRFDPRNGLAFMLRVFKMIKSEYSDVRLIIVGYGPMKYYYEKLVPPSLKQDVFFEGMKWGSRPRYYSTCDVFCSPITKASFGVTLLEAMACGKPIVATANVGYRELLSGNEGFLIPSGNHRAFADAILLLLNDSSLRAQMGENGRKKALGFSWEKITYEIMDYYKEILGRT